LKSQNVEVWGDGEVTRDFIYVGDVADAVYLATTNPVSGVFNVGTGTGLSLRDILKQIARVLDREPVVTWLPSRSFDVPRIVLDATKLKKATNWTCRTGLEDGVAITADWLRKVEF
jgi:UDP-glucose 4-epimerase